jgi:Caspase domain.
MKKRILLIGNNDGLEGVNIDFQNYNRFFQSKVGGEWYLSEITSMMNPSRRDVINKINELKAMFLDYIIVIFSGHGGQERETMLELNKQGETISESELKYISPRQLNIYDCCRSYPSITEAVERSLKMFNSGDKIEYSTRIHYEQRIANSIQQQICLYACSIGETAEDTSKGGVYSSNLLDMANAITKSTSKYLLVGEAHVGAKNVVKARGYKQNPEAILPRCMSNQQLIFSINPYIY